MSDDDGVRLWLVDAPVGAEHDRYVCWTRIDAERVAADEVAPVEGVWRPLASDAALRAKAAECDKWKARAERAEALLDEADELTSQFLGHRCDPMDNTCDVCQWLTRLAAARGDRK